MLRAMKAKSPRLGPVVLTLASLIRRTATLSYRRGFGLQSNEWRVLVLVADNGPMSNTELCERMAQDKGQVSRAISAMVDAGYVLREPRGRAVRVSLTESGRTLARELIAISRRRSDALLDGLDLDERRVLFDCLARISANARALCEDEAQAAGAGGADPLTPSPVSRPRSARRRLSPGTARR